MKWLIIALILIAGCTSGAMYHPEITSEEVFLKEMIPHHQEAIDTSKYMLEHSSNEEIRDLAQRIIDAQEIEINAMNAILNEIETTSYRAGYQDMMRNQKRYSGVELDIVFIEDMIHHHEMAIVMAWQAERYPLTEKTQSLVDNIKETQTAEVKEMIDILYKLK